MAADISRSHRYEEPDFPPGLADMIEAFAAGCDAKNKQVSPEVPPLIAERFGFAFDEASGSWENASAQVLTVARLAGRLAALYADLDGSPEVEWAHARFGLRDAQAECRAEFGVRGKHCMNVDLGLP